MRNDWTTFALAAAAMVSISGVTPGFAAIVGSDDFNSYTAGDTLNGKTGGAGWQVNSATNVNDSSVAKSAWSDLSWGNDLVVTADGKVRTDGGAATVYRGFNGESNQWPFTNRDVPQLFFAYDVSFAATPSWGGLSPIDNPHGDEQAKFGFHGTAFGIERYHSGQSGWSDVQGVTIQLNTNYRVVGQMLFADDNAQNGYLRMWIDPTNADLSSPDLEISFNTTSESDVNLSGIRIGGDSGSTNFITFDNVAIATEWGDVVPVPEPTMLAALAVVPALALRRRRQ